MMSFWVAVYPLLVLALVGVAIYEHVTTSHLALPLSRVLTALTIILPVLGALHNFALPSLYRSLTRTPGGLRQCIPFFLQCMQLVITTVFATLLASEASPSPVRDCLLEGKWKKLWTDHDGEAIRAIQDALGCCGFRSVKDMAWPFPKGQPGEGGETCAAKYGRTLACREPWQQAMGSAAGWDLAVAVCAGLLQVVGWVLITKFGDRLRDSPVWNVVSRVLGRDEPPPDEEERARPLLGAAEEDNGERRVQAGYSGLRR